MLLLVVRCLAFVVLQPETMARDRAGDRAGECGRTLLNGRGIVGFDGGNSASVCAFAGDRYVARY